MTSELVEEVRGPNGADRVLAILNVLGSYPDGIGLNDLARLMHSPRSSVHRALERPASRRAHRAGPRQPLPPGIRPAQAGLLLLRGARRGGPDAPDPRGAGEPSSARRPTTRSSTARRSSTWPRSSRPRRRYQMNSVIGGRNPAYCTGVGKALLAYELTSRVAVAEYATTHGPLRQLHRPHHHRRRRACDAEFDPIRARRLRAGPRGARGGHQLPRDPALPHLEAVPDGAISITAVAQRFPLARLEASIDRARDMIREHLGEVMA